MNKIKPTTYDLAKLAILNVADDPTASADQRRDWLLDLASLIDVRVDAMNEEGT